MMRWYKEKKEEQEFQAYVNVVVSDGLYNKSTRNIEK
jgi:hypothetical protein